MILKMETGLRFRPALGSLLGRVLAYPRLRGEVDYLRLYAEAADGLVLHTGAGAEAGATLRREGYEGVLVVDPALYRIPSDRPEQVSLLGSRETEWISIQSSLRVAAYMSPSPFVPPGDLSTLQDVLTRGREFLHRAEDDKHQAPAYVVLPLDQDWLKGDLPLLLKTLQSGSLPVALVLASPWNPVGTSDSVNGLVSVVRELENVAILRSDIAALGAVAYGATFGAIGTGAAVRHLVPPGRRGGGVANDNSPNALVQDLLSYLRGSTLAQMHDAGARLPCQCGVCEGAHLGRFEDPRLEPEADRHSVLVWSSEAKAITALGVNDRPAAWARRCEAAIRRAEELVDEALVDIHVQPYLRAWADLA